MTTIGPDDFSELVGEALSGVTFANLLIAQITKMVSAVDLRPEEALEIRFEDGSTVAVSLRPEHYVGAEAINLFLKDQGMVVI
jgi:hypothetical protein